MSLFTIIGCGSTAKDWIQRGHSIGVNDAYRFGKEFDSLLVCNRPVEFSRLTDSGETRFQVITKTPCKNFYSHKSNWAQWFPYWQKIPLVGWYGTLHREQCYSSNTSPFIAMSLAFHIGATDIILYGVDFVDHHMFSKEAENTKLEAGYYMQLISKMKEQGCRVWLGTNGSYFDNQIELWPNI